MKRRGLTESPIFRYPRQQRAAAERCYYDSAEA
jgi:hypothetical protein